MQRLIDADVLYDEITDVTSSTGHDIMSVKDIRWWIAHSTTIDAVPVVRCKDCMFARKVDSRREPKWKCVHLIWDGCTQWRESNFYCAYGEKNSANLDLEE